MWLLVRKPMCIYVSELKLTQRLDHRLSLSASMRTRTQHPGLRSRVRPVPRPLVSALSCSRTRAFSGLPPHTCSARARTRAHTPVAFASSSADSRPAAAGSEEPQADADRGRAPATIPPDDVKRILRLAHPERWRLAAAVGFLTVSSAVTMSAPFLLGKVIDTIYSSGADTEAMTASLTSLCMVLSGVFLCGGAANAARVYLMQISGQQIVRDLRASVFSSILRQEMAFFDRNRTGELINRLSADTAVVGRSITDNLSDGLRAVAQAAAGVSMMFYVSPSLAGFVLLIVPPVAVLAVIYGRYLRSISRRTQDALAQATELAEERISNLRTVRAFGKELSELSTYTKKADLVLGLAQKEALLRAGFFGVTGLSGNMMILSVLYKGGLLMASQHMTVGELSSFLMYTFWVGISVAGLSSFYSELMKGFGAGSRLWQLLDRRPEFPLNEGQVLPPEQLKGQLQFSDVSFAYPTRKEALIFQNLSLLVPAGSVMAVVGSSGSGKSTLVSLLLRLYDTDAGVITIDGHDIRDLNPYWLRSHIGTVSQEPVLFSCSIRDNIAYGAMDPDTVTTEDVYRAARVANAYDFIQAFPKGFDTVVGEKGVLLSGGQKQRIAIARALLKNPKILLLDEATSALDAENEFLVQEALERLMEGRTVMIIAHRLSTIQNANAVAVLDQHRIAECGPHTELLGNRQGLFRKLMEKQAFLQDEQKQALRFVPLTEPGTMWGFLRKPVCAHLSKLRLIHSGMSCLDHRLSLSASLRTRTQIPGMNSRVRPVPGPLVSALSCSRTRAFSGLPPHTCSARARTRAHTPVAFASSSADSRPAAAGSEEPQADADRGLTPAQVSPQDVRRIVRLAHPQRWRMAAAVGFLTVSSAVSMSAPFLFGKVIDTIYSSGADTEAMTASLTSLCMVLSGVFLCGGAANAARVYLMQISGQQIVRDLRVSVFSSILGQEVAFFDRNRTGELINRLSADTAVVGHAVTDNLSDGLRAVAQAVAGVSMMFYVSPSLASFVLLIVPPVAGLAVVYGRYIYSISKRTQDALAQATQLAEECISSLRTVRAFGQESLEVSKYTGKADLVLGLARKEALLEAGYFGVVGVSMNMMMLLVLYKGGLLTASQHMTVGALTSFLMYTFWVGISVTGLSSFYSELMKGFGAGSRLWQLLDRRPEFPLNEGQVLPPEQLKGQLQFSDVSFAYPTRKEALIFQNLSLLVPAGSVMAVVGSSGSGKSTLVSLLLRLYDTDAGVITIDGHDIRDLNPYWLRSHIGTVSQEPVLFSCSIRDNIAYGAMDPDTVTTEDVYRAARVANAYDFIQAFPKGFDTVVGEKGVLLSGGQKQRIAIARALLKNPKILLLDEATSALDAENEFLVQEALERLMEGRTVMIIAHRLSTIQNANAVAVLDQHRIAECGPHTELLGNRQGLFRKLMEKQAFLQDEQKQALR
ncbi:bile salt export pump [Betta splendens]|uniref:ATP-binding cassette sub-family B member 10, mitochondrial n=1 Tax=Betta splendens TaxID=158456 RepID=A0A8M1HC49_BETSP|nr:bile salt export pump [Betta splendens]